MICFRVSVNHRGCMQNYRYAFQTFSETFTKFSNLSHPEKLQNHKFTDILE